VLEIIRKILTRLFWPNASIMSRFPLHNNLSAMIHKPHVSGLFRVLAIYRPSNACEWK
jgi:hypothetical protein